MKTTGVTRKLDELGRVVIPKELRNTLGIKAKSPVEIFVEGEYIVLQKYQPSGICTFTGKVSTRNISLANSKITLSPEGAKQLLAELEQYLETVSEEEESIVGSKIKSTSKERD
ncbi:AbrB family transcriptional regulator [Bacillus cereus VD196]|uniref:AbrB family transcriptional regulator n=1 Tax=Bacillus cereus VD196 TaxID=1053243 RepID=A0A9W5V623_BACCE|nr:AbrB family transcriptional regulator [Bacillus cereus VD196]